MIMITITIICSPLLLSVVFILGSSSVKKNSVPKSIFSRNSFRALCHVLPVPHFSRPQKFGFLLNINNTAEQMY